MKAQECTYTLSARDAIESGSIEGVFDKRAGEGMSSLVLQNSAP